MLYSLLVLTHKIHHRCRIQAICHVFQTLLKSRYEMGIWLVQVVREIRQRNRGTTCNTLVLFYHRLFFVLVNCLTHRKMFLWCSCNFITKLCLDLAFFLHSAPMFSHKLNFPYPSLDCNQQHWKAKFLSNPCLRPLFLFALR